MKILLFFMNEYFRPSYLDNHFDSSSKTEHEYWQILILEMFDQCFPQSLIVAAIFLNSMGQSTSSLVLDGLTSVFFLTKYKYKYINIYILAYIKITYETLYL